LLAKELEEKLEAALGLDQAKLMTHLKEQLAEKDKIMADQKLEIDDLQVIFLSFLSKKTIHLNQSKHSSIPIFPGVCGWFGGRVGWY